jgi:hypothetical protein
MARQTNAYPLQGAARELCGTARLVGLHAQWGAILALRKRPVRVTRCWASRDRPAMAAKPGIGTGVRLYSRRLATESSQKTVASRAPAPRPAEGGNQQAHDFKRTFHGCAEAGHDTCWIRGRYFRPADTIAWWRRAGWCAGAQAGPEVASLERWTVRSIQGSHPPQYLVCAMDRSA